MKVSNSIKAFLEAKRDQLVHPDLLDFFLANFPGLETQVMVAAGKGQPVQGRRSTYTDGLNEWWQIRIPKQADSDPFWGEYDLKWPLELHCVSIGSTGWHWQNRRSLYVGFDFDAIAGHAEGVGIKDEKLAEVRDAACALPWVRVRRSTSGSGIHLYVFFDKGGVATENHTEHAALARYILGLMSAEVGFNFASQIDACGGNMWCWAKKTSLENRGFENIKTDEFQFFPADKVPDSWRDHIDVITRKRAKTRVGNVEPGNIDIFEALTSAHRVVPLEEAHKNQMDEIEQAGFAVQWVSDHHMLQTHTRGFAYLMENHKEEMGLQGGFETNSKGANPGEANCFAFPGDGGSWKIYRFSPGISEARTWEQDGQGYTTCWFNRKPNLKAAARATGGRDLKSGGYEFDSLEKAAKVAEALGQTIQVEDQLKHRKAVVSKSKDGRLTIEVAKEAGDVQMGDWNNSDKKNAWTQVFDIPTEPLQEEITSYDDKIRCLTTPDTQPAGWATRSKRGEWLRKTASSVKMILQRHGNAKPDAEILMGAAEDDPWKLVAEPFKPEYPGDRQWNLNAPQLVYAPVPRGVEYEHPTWDLMLSHLGKDLDPYLRELEWAQKCNILTGGDYLTAWYAAIIRDPLLRLPYLFFFGDENNGKSSYWEAFQLLVTGGVVKADRSLTSQNDFNGELVGAIMCVVEEKNISKADGAAAKIKDAVTTLTLSIRRMRQDTYQIVNMTHWCQFANNQDALMVPPGSTRITVIYVTNFAKEIPKDELHARLKAEAPAFMRTLIDFQLPPVTGRLALPIVETRHKERSEELSRSLLETFVREETHFVVGEKSVTFAEFFQKFNEWLPEDERYLWTKHRVSKSLPMNHPSGKAGGGGKLHIGNLSWEAKAPEAGAQLLIVKERKLVPENG